MKVFFKYDLAKNKMEFKSLFFDERNFIFPEYDLSTSLSNAEWLISTGSIEVNASSDEIHSVYSLSNNFYNWDFIARKFVRS